jgi:glyoxylase-like metal-dependent hydrolase (beta-lactamase superfamily II)
MKTLPHALASHPARMTRAALQGLALVVALTVGGTAGPWGTAQAAAPQQKTQAPGWYRLMVGTVEVTALSDGTVNLPVDQLLHAPKGRVAQDLRMHYLSTPLETSVNAYLINTGTRLVLIDAGAGSLFGPTLGRLSAQVIAAGYKPEQVDDVLITHMHADHVGGLVADGKLVFPNATVHADKADQDFWLAKANLDAAPADKKGFFQGAMASVNPYVDAGKFMAFTADGEVVPGVRVQAAHGHTPGHAVYVVESEGKRLVLLGDLAHVASVQLASPEVTIGFDSDEPKARAARAKLFKALASDGSLIALAHFPFPGLGRLRASGKGYTWEALNYSSQVK